MVIFSESKAGSNSGLTILRPSCPGQGSVCGPCDPLISLHGKLPILEVSFTSLHKTQAGGTPRAVGPWTVHPSPLKPFVPDALGSRLGSVGQEEPTAAAQDSGDLLGWSIEGTDLLAGSTEVLWGTSPSLQGPHFHRCV